MGQSSLQGGRGSMISYPFLSQRRAIESTCCRKGFRVTFHCNLLHTVIAAIKDAIDAAHSDKSALLCSDDKEYCPAGENLWLPKQQQMQIMTLTLSYSTETHSTGLTYSTTNGVITKHTIPLGSCCLHFQGAGSQAPGIQHQSTVLRNCTADFPSGCVFVQCASP